eukprot:m.158296 g.158296  ORF g.158296 m.158296 type:complete len:54 (+) comp13351_c7_seq1:109-270(+)
MNILAFVYVSFIVFATAFSVVRTLSLQCMSLYAVDRPTISSVTTKLVAVTQES